MARRCEYEPAFQWLCGPEPVGYHTLSDFRSQLKAGLDNLFVPVLGMLSAEGLITLERVTLDGTKIKANADSPPALASGIIPRMSRLRRWVVSDAWFFISCSLLPRRRILTPEEFALSVQPRQGGMGGPAGRLVVVERA